MRLYIEFIKNAFQVNIAYRMDVLLHALGSLITIFIQISIWSALFKGGSVAISTAGVVTFPEMITYTIISTVISVIVSNEIIFLIEEKIKTGEIALDLLKPMNFKAYLFSQTIGNNIFRVVFELVPLLAIGIFLFGLRYPSPQNFAIFLITLVNGAIIYLLMSYILGLTGFWYIVTWHFNTLLRIMVILLSGAFIPLWFFPKFLLKISLVLPFRLIYFTPISVYLGRTGYPETLWLILQQFFWIGILWAVERIVWFKATKKLIIQGG